MLCTIISSHASQANTSIRALKRLNISTRQKSPRSLTSNDCRVDVIFIPSQMSDLEWKQVLDQIRSEDSPCPIITLGPLPIWFYSTEVYSNLAIRCIQLSRLLSSDQIAFLIKELCQKNTGKRTQNEDRILDEDTRELIGPKRKTTLTKKEFYMLKLLLRNIGQVISREKIVEYVWDKRTYVSQNTIDVYISRLRKKLSSAKNSPKIKTYPCLGYSLDF